MAGKSRNSAAAAKGAEDGSYYGNPNVKKGEPSPFAVMNQRKRREEMRNAHNVCGAKTSGTGKPCRKTAGHGTNHPGTGRCSLHGGRTVAHQKAAAKKVAHDFLGTPMDINPFDAIIWCIKIRAGEIKWLSDRMAELDQKAWLETTMVGKQFHVYARERHRAMQDLTKFSAMAVGLGIAERAVKLAEQYGELLAQYTQNLLNDLWPHLDEEGRAKAPGFVRLRLVQLDAGREPELPQLEAGRAA